jgi:hypothetical protein
MNERTKLIATMAAILFGSRDKDGSGDSTWGHQSLERDNSQNPYIEVEIKFCVAIAKKLIEEAE